MAWMLQQGSLNPPKRNLILIRLTRHLHGVGRSTRGTAVRLFSQRVGDTSLAIPRVRTHSSNTRVSLESRPACRSFPTSGHFRPSPIQDDMSYGLGHSQNSSFSFSAPIRVMSDSIGFCAELGRLIKTTRRNAGCFFVLVFYLVFL